MSDRVSTLRLRDGDTVEYKTFHETFAKINRFDSQDVVRLLKALLSALEDENGMSVASAVRIGCLGAGCQANDIDADPDLEGFAPEFRQAAALLASLVEEERGP